MEDQQIFRPSKPAWESDDWNITQIYLEQMKQYRQTIEANELLQEKRKQCK